MTPNRDPQNQTFVTYPQLITYFLSTVALILAVAGFMISSIESRVSKDLYNRDYATFCASIGRIETTLKENQAAITLISKNQILVLRSLKITPVESVAP
jgi:hypothetical protein